MRKCTFMILAAIYAAALGAEKADDLFSDNIPFVEFDADFPDDFADIEKNEGLSIKDSLVAPSYEPFLRRGIKRQERSLSLSVANDIVGRMFYFSLMPQARFQIWNTSTHLGVPLKFPVYDNIASGKASTYRQPGFVRAKDFLSPWQHDFKGLSDLDRLIRSFSIGNSEDKFALRFAREESFSIGHGDLMREMDPSGLYDQDFMFASGHSHFDGFSINALLGPVPKVSVLAMDVRFLPFSSLKIPSGLQSTNASLSYVADFIAPHNARIFDGSLVLTDNERSVKRESGMAQGISLGLGNEYGLSSWLSSKPYISYSHLFLSKTKHNNIEEPWHYGTAFNLGHDAIFYPIPFDKNHMIFCRTEARLFSKYYYPNYFGGHYMLDRVNFSENAAIISKSQELALQTNSSPRFGHLVEIGYALDDILRTKIGYENAYSLGDGNSIKRLRKLHFLADINALETLKINLAYEHSAINEMIDIFDIGNNRALLSLKSQVKLLSFLYFDTWLKHSFGVSDKFRGSPGDDSQGTWLSHAGEKRSLNFGLGIELAMVL
jgi:hypothetical protein